MTGIRIVKSVSLLVDCVVTVLGTIGGGVTVLGTRGCVVTVLGTIDCVITVLGAIGYEDTVHKRVGYVVIISFNGRLQCYNNLSGRLQYKI